MKISQQTETSFMSNKISCSFSSRQTLHITKKYQKAEEAFVDEQVFGVDENWPRVLFCDERKFNLVSSHGKRYQME